jgi:D-sedoheptulose 7-phosphate isomerase
MADGGEVKKGFLELSRLAEEVGHLFAPEVEALVDDIGRAFQAGGKLIFCGNGGSAADAQHLAAEYVVRFSRSRRALPALALTTDTSLLTAGANDFGFEEVFSRQLEALGRPGDVLFLHSTSGESENVLRAARTAKLLGISTVGFLARGGGRLAELVDRALVVPTNSTARAQEIHITLGHVICELVEDRIVAEKGADRE